MNEIIKSLYERKSMRVYEDRPIPEKERKLLKVGSRVVR